MGEANVSEANVSAGGKPPYDPISLSSFQFWSQPPADRQSTLERLRKERPVSWQRPLEDQHGTAVARPYWAILKHKDIGAISRDTATFRSGEGIQIDDVPVEVERRFASFLNMDPPDHTRMRGFVQQAFGVRQVAKLEDGLKRKSKEIVDELIAQGPCDFVRNVSMRLPMWILAELMGVPESERLRLSAAADKIAGRADPEYQPEPDTLMRCLTEMEETGRALAKERMKNPKDDVLSGLTQAHLDGADLTLDEIVSIFVVFIIGGNDNVRHATSATMKALCDFPDQRRLLMSDYDKYISKATDEFLRWATTTPTMRRTATRDVVVRGVEIKKGDKVVLFYNSGNRDEEAFADPYKLDITREMNRHVAFGGGGIHFCIGAPLARMQLRIIFKELLHRIPDLEAGDPDHTTSSQITGIKRMPCYFKQK
jgi:cytochrome P450